MNKTIKISEGTHRRLTGSKNAYAFDTYDECINFLVIKDARIRSKIKKGVN